MQLRRRVAGGRILICWPKAVLSDRSACRVETSWLDFGGESIPPGSTIYVARDISGIDLHQIIINTTQIFSQLVVTAAS